MKGPEGAENSRELVLNTEARVLNAEGGEEKMMVLVQKLKSLKESVCDGGRKPENFRAETETGC
jgi:hypothetical protein